MVADEATEHGDRRLVLLGASNVARGFPSVVAAARQVWGRPVHIHAACGHGRGYGTTSQVLGRTLPPILSCGIWKALDQLAPAPTAALLTDIGNDLVFGVAPDRILDWIATCLERLTHCDVVLVTRLPLASLRRLPSWQFYLFRSVFFPRSRLAHHEALERAAKLDAGLAQLEQKFGITPVTPDDRWYGFDPIHIQRRSEGAAWKTLLSHWNSSSVAPVPVLRFSRWRALRMRPLERKLFGFQQRRRQPTCRLKDNSTVSLY